jgi:DHA3 family macrolide efflux protein-like MFS transporter
MIDVVTAVVGIVPLFFYRIPQPKAESHVSQRSLLGEIRDGARFVAHRRGWLMLFAVSGLVVLTVMPTFALTPLLVKQHFGGGVNQVALMEGMAGVGIIVGGLLVTIWAIPARRIVVVLVSFAISCGTVALTALAPGTWLWLAVFWWFVSGVTYSTGNAPMMAIVQINIPNELQGRVISLLNMVYGLAGPVGLALAAPVGEVLGVQNLYIIGGTLSALVCGAGLLSPALRTIESRV